MQKKQEKIKENEKYDTSNIATHLCPPVVLHDFFDDKLAMDLISSFFILKDDIRFEFSNELVWQQKQNSYTDITLVCGTNCLIEVLGKLWSQRIMTYSVSPSSHLHICRSYRESCWHLTISKETSRELVHVIFSNILEREDTIKIKGNMNDCFYLDGLYNDGIIEISNINLVKIHQYYVLKEYGEKHKHIVQGKEETSLPIATARHLITLKRQDIFSIRLHESHKSHESHNQEIIVRLHFNQKQVSKLLGREGARLNSIRVQLKCWIRVLPPTHEFGSTFCASQRNTKQEIVIRGLKRNIEVAIDEFGKALDSRY